MHMHINICMCMSIDHKKLANFSQVFVNAFLYAYAHTYTLMRIL